MEIGTKIRQARLEVQMTQEQAAETLGVSRQTVSNWENGRSYPDIVSVLKMSDLYHVSLDYLLKGETRMDGYTSYLDESTNVVKSRNRFSRLAVILAYLVIWSAAVFVFWCFTDGSDAMGYALIFLWIVLPLATFTDAYLIGRNDMWGKWKWLSAGVFGMMYMLAEYATFSAANSAAFGKVNMPEFSMIAAGAAFALAGLGLGTVIRSAVEKREKRRAARE